MFFKRGSGTETSPNEAAVRRVLAEVRDPDLGKDIVALGFVQNVVIAEGKVSFTVELTTPACPVKEELKAQCEAAVKSLPGVTDVEVTMTSRVRGAAGASGGTQAKGQKLTLPGVQHLIAIASGKGGVGKSTVTTNLAYALADTGARVGILDADIYGPSVPLLVGSKARPVSEGDRVIPVDVDGVKVISMGFFIAENQPVVWRGPMVHGALTQFLTQVDWGELDYLLVDMPPGTGDVQLSLSQIAPLSGAVIVTTPQEVSVLDARKGLRMFETVSVPILGVVENMAGFVCGDCEKITPIFGEGGGLRLAQAVGAPFLGSVPLEPRIVLGGDSGRIAVRAYPESRAAVEFRRIAGEVAAQLSVQQFQRSGFQPMSMDWQT